MSTSKNRSIYLDNQATTQLDPRVLEAMMPYLTTKFGNPSSGSHKFGWAAKEAVEQAREQVASSIGAEPKDIVFTSGATEANNIAVKGSAFFNKDKGRHIITVATEHKCVLESCRYLAKQGFEITYLPVQTNGLIDLAKLKQAIRDDTILVSIMFVHNEIGVIQPIEEIGAICKERNIYFHTDAAQAFGKLEIDVNKMNIDLLSISGHKIYGPKGVGALYVRRKNPRIRLESPVHGGGQERNIRSGTLATPLIVGLGEAARIAKLDMQKDREHIGKLAKLLADGIENIPDVYLNGDKHHRIIGSLNYSFAYIEGESLLGSMHGIAVSSGSACTSESLEPSYVLYALGLSDELAHTSLRFGIGRFNTMEEINIVLDVLTKAVTRLRELSPLWEMVQEGVDLSTIKWKGHH